MFPIDAVRKLAPLAGSALLVAAVCLVPLELPRVSPPAVPAATSFANPVLSPGKALVADMGRLILIDLQSGEQTLLRQGDAGGMAISPTGEILVAVPSRDVPPTHLSGTSAKLIKLSFDAHSGKWRRSVVTSGGLLRSPNDVKFDRNHDLIVADSAGLNDWNGRIVRVKPNTGAQSLISLGGLLASTSRLVITGNGIVTTSFWDMDGGPSQVLRIDAQTGAQSVISENGYFEDPAAAAVGPNGDIYVAEANGFGPSSLGEIIRVNPGTGAQRVISSKGLLVQPIDMEFDTRGDLIVVDTGRIGAPPRLLRINPSTGSQQVISSGGLLNLPARIALTR